MLLLFLYILLPSCSSSYAGSMLVTPIAFPRTLVLNCVDPTVLIGGLISPLRSFISGAYVFVGGTNPSTPRSLVISYAITSLDLAISPNLFSASGL